MISKTLAELLAPFSDYGKSTSDKPKEWLRSLFRSVMAYAKPRGQKVSIGKTDPLFGERQYNATIVAGKNSKKVQFPSDEKLPDGRHRYFKKNGVLVDRANDK